jgi:mRNA-degrading endonuclease RelE of RelBE toxin-antitoxin system
MKVEIADQVRNFVRALPPIPRGKLRTALRHLEQERGDIKALEGPLDPYFRLRIGSYRVIFRYHVAGNARLIRCDFAERRSVVYEAFQRFVE